MIAALQVLATLTATLFAGAALYINVAEHPARMLLEPRIALLQWAPSYQRATWLQAPLALISFMSGGSAWLLGSSVHWLLGAVCIGAVVPFTFAVIMRTNRQLLALNRDSSEPETRELLERWAKLHAVRTMLSLAAAVIYLCSYGCDRTLTCCPSIS